MGRVLVGLGLLALVVVVAGLWSSCVSNPRVVEELRADPDGERARRVMLLTLPSGRSLPVNFLREGNLVYAGADFPWWRELRGEGGPVEVLVRGEVLRGHGRAIEGDPSRTEDVFSRLRPDVPKWLPSWLDAVLVVIALEAGESPSE